jgi:hypothetical protein
MHPKATLLYVFRGKVETEVVLRWDATTRAIQLRGCTRATIYATETGNDLVEYGPNYWVKAVNPPNEIKLAAMLVI